MGIFAETANVDYRLSLLTKENNLPFSVCGKQTEVCRLQKNKQKFAVSVFRLQ
jgi:hypothetical protein